MKTNFTRTKLATLSILATLAYCLLIMSSFTEGLDDFKLGFKDGYNLKLQTYFLDLKAKKSFSTFPDSITNLKTGEKISIRYNKAQVRAAITPASGKAITTYQVIQSLMALIALFIVIAIPVLFLKLMKTLTKEVIFDKVNIKYMRKIGVLLFVFYIVNLLTNCISYQMNVSMFDFTDYTIQREPNDLIWILLGIVVLLFAEILSKGSKIKEEQDLTI
jgi:hypothetical protein